MASAAADEEPLGDPVFDRGGEEVAVGQNAAAEQERDVDRAAGCGADRIAGQLLRQAQS